MTARALQNRLTCGLAAAGIGLAGFALYLLSVDARPIPPQLPDTPSADPPPVTPIGFDMQAVTIERYAAMVERPLFTATRRPPPAESAAPQSAPVPLPTQFALEGVVLAPDQRSAIFRNTTTSKVMRVPEGAPLGSWTVETLEPDRVVLKHRDSAHEITLRHFDATPPAGGGVRPSASRHRSPPR